MLTVRKGRVRQRPYPASGADGMLVCIDVDVKIFSNFYAHFW